MAGRATGESVEPPCAGLLDPSTGEWSRLAELPERAESGFGIGVLRRSGGYYFAGDGWVLDTTTDSWFEVARLDRERLHETVVNAGRPLLVFGGARLGAKTPGGQVARRCLDVVAVRRAATLAVLVGIALMGCGSTDGTRPRAQERPSSDIAFSFGGSLYALAPDGSERVRLTRPLAGPGGMGSDSQPAWSPDGTRLAFVRSEPPSETARTRIFLIDPDGGRPQPLTNVGEAAAPAWSPDGRRIAFVRRTDTEWAIVAVEVDGGGERVLLREPNEPDSPIAFDAPAWSPDGTRIVYTRWTRGRRFSARPRLYVMDANGGSARLLARDGADAAWSPDGRRIAFASVRDRNGERCYEQCQLFAELYVMNADGTGLERLTRNRGHDHAPSWSPDGRRIAFASDRNSPGVGNHEVYSIRPDGSCVTWLTNGTPSSDDPAWRSPARSPSRPRACGPTRLRPRVAVDTGQLPAIDRPPVYWLGKRHRGSLLTHAEVLRDGQSSRLVYLHYDDCARFRPRDCPRPLQLQEVSVCSRHGSSTVGVVDDPEWAGHVRALAAHGLLVVDIGDGIGVVAGSTHIRLFGELGGTRGRQQLINTASRLRQIGRPKAELPSPRLPRALLRKLQRTQRAHARLGSIDATARTLNAPRPLVRLRLEFAHAVRSLPQVRAITCPRR
jgi:Tol biopolymer transport system component